MAPMISPPVQMVAPNGRGSTAQSELEPRLPGERLGRASRPGRRFDASPTPSRSRQLAGPTEEEPLLQLCFERLTNVKWHGIGMLKPDSGIRPLDEAGDRFAPSSGWHLPVGEVRAAGECRCGRDPSHRTRSTPGCRHRSDNPRLPGPTQRKAELACSKPTLEMPGPAVERLAGICSSRPVLHWSQSRWCGRIPRRPA